MKTQDYSLTKYQGKHNTAGETYETIEKFGENTPMDVITIRNRIFSNALTMREVINQVLDDGWGYSDFHCSFCRGAAMSLKKVESFDPNSSIVTLTIDDV
jgi:hypothetical protein